MSSKEQKHSEPKASAKPRSPKLAVHDLETAAKQAIQPDVVEGPGLDPGSLTTGHVLQLQRTAGNRTITHLLENGHAQISKSSTVHIQRYYEGINEGDPRAVEQYVRRLFGQWAGRLYPKAWRIQNSQRLLNEAAPERRDLVESLYNAHFPSGPDLTRPVEFGPAGPPAVIPAAGVSTSMAELTLEEARASVGMGFQAFNASPQGKRFRFYNQWKGQPSVPLPNTTTEGDQAFWFNYFWKEAQGFMTDQERVWVLEGWIVNSGTWPTNTPVINPTTSDAEKLARMKLMVDRGMRKYDHAHQVIPANVLNQLGTTQRIAVGYRGEKWLTRATAETVGKLPQVGDPARVAALHMDAPWHPYSIPEIAKDCLFRKVNTDNCLYTLTSIAKEFVDATKFPFVQQMDLGDLRVVTDAGGNAIACRTTIRIFMINASKMTIYDPVSAGATQWAGGEYAVRAIKPGEFLAELEVTRLHPRETALAAPPIQTADFNAECGHKYRVTDFHLMPGATSNPDIERLVRAKIAELQVPQTYNNVANDGTGRLSGIAF